MEQVNEIFIKGMVCERCMNVVKRGIASLGISIGNISLGRITLLKAPGSKELNQISEFLSTQGFELINDRQTRLVNQVKKIVSEVMTSDANDNFKIKFSVVLSKSLGMNYDYISEIFTKLEGVTLEKYIIEKRVERVKELLAYTPLTITQIADKTGYSGVNHLSRQFKELTGLTPSHFRSELR